ncbi:hypothetical protein N7493_003302 [Penicillium malachiteum]|uniref:aldehyde dehydrogenase (NAD(+)) n=1 Tax=Penicillium malachiteum TaxID=1324776 RepID=A0AAD6HPC8_9EURO|nr:hypothetical protein N7493_003302 [Penicillium malachiteum]
MASLLLIEDVIEDDETRIVIRRHVPLGVVGVIVPWNFPLMIATGKIVPALLTGNVPIVKPSGYPPSPGVMQSLRGDDNSGPWLTAHPGIDKISFTGSIATGSVYYRALAGHGNVDGNDPAIVFPDIDVKNVAETVEILCRILRIVRLESDLPKFEASLCAKPHFDKFRDVLARQVESCTVGDGSKTGISHGPLQNDMQYSLVKIFFEGIDEQGWKAIIGGRIEPSSGYMVTPTIIDRHPDNSRIVVEERFGDSIVPLLSWDDEAEVIDLSPTAPFGGRKESGVGVEWGLNGLKGFCNTQTLFLKKSV